MKECPTSEVSKFCQFVVTFCSGSGISEVSEFSYSCGARPVQGVVLLVAREYGKNGIFTQKFWKSVWKHGVNVNEHSDAVRPM